MTVISLVQGSLRLILDPVHGGIVRRFTLTLDDAGEVDLLRPMPDGSTDVLDAACFPLIPFSNRIGFGRFRFDGREMKMPPNFPPEPHVIHGHGWRSRWEVIDIADDRCTIAYSHPESDWPWRYRATQAFVLTDLALTVRLTLTNLDTRPIPAGIGLHPYFPKYPGARLNAALDHVWINDEAKLPSRRMPLDGLPVSSLLTAEIDNCFGGWNGRASLTWETPGLSLDIEADWPFDHLVNYVPPGEDHFCVEPVSHANDAVNLAARGVDDVGFRALGSDESLSGSIRFRVRAGAG